MKLLSQLIDIASPSGCEFPMREFLIDYIGRYQRGWKVQPEVIGEDLHDALILVFGKPKTAIFAHMDTTGFTVRYQDQLIAIGGPEVKDGYDLVGKDTLGPIECKLKVDEENQLFYHFPRAIETGTALTFKPVLSLSKNHVEAPYLDNRVGIYNALKVAETLEHGAIVFSTYEEHGGGSVPLLVRYLWENFRIRQTLISDVTWVTDGVKPGKGVVISLRDRNIPRQIYLEKIIQLAKESSIPFQLEVEGNGSSDGREIHHSPYPVDWCFIGAPESGVHSPKEKIHLFDLQCMIELYQYLMKHL